MSAASTLMTEFTGADDAWLAQHQHRKVLDPRDLVAKYQPCSQAGRGPARTSKSSGSAPGAEPSEHSRPAWARRRDTRGGSANKWSADAPAPWPNLYWLVCPRLSQRVGRLEHLGWVQQLQQQVASEPQGALASGLAAAHAAYGQTRWAALSEEDRCYVEEAGYAPKLRDMGVAGLEYPNQVKCLHTHLAHFLAGGDNPVGRWVVGMLERGEDALARGMDGGGAIAAQADPDQ
eukprot:jgi/Tetstr1/436775/TSEL_025555.t1